MRTEYVMDEELTNTVSAVVNEEAAPEFQWIRDYGLGIYCAMGVRLDDNGDTWPLRNGPVKLRKVSDMELLFTSDSAVQLYLVMDYHFWSKVDERTRKAKLCEQFATLKPSNFKRMQTTEHKPKDESMDTCIKWTDEEWQAIAKRARALKDSRPDLSWMQLVLVCQDDIAPERRRFSFNKLIALKPMFDILGLDHEGNVPPPPPPPPLPEPVIVSPPFALPTPPPAPTNLSGVPVDALVTEILNRGASVKALAEDVVVTRKIIEEGMAAHIDRMALLDKRVDAMEELVLKVDDRMTDVLNRCERINADYTEMAKLSKVIRDALQACAPNVLTEVSRRTALGGLELIQTEMRNGTMDRNGDLNVPKAQRIAALRFLVVGPMQKDIARIKERLPRSLNVDLVFGENSDHIKLPANIDYCIISGHADYTRRWQTCRDFYGQSKVHRMENGSIGTFASQIEVLASLHTKQHAKAA